MKLGSWRRIYKNDFSPQYADLVEQLSLPINSAMEELYNALSGRLSFQDNINSTIVTFNVTVDSTGKPTKTTQFKLNSGQSTLQGCQVINAVGVNNKNLTVTATPFISFSLNGSLVTVKNIQGLQPNQAYTLTVNAIG